MGRWLSGRLMKELGLVNYYVLTVAGQSNAMAYGEGLPLPDKEDAPHPRIKQLARFAHTHPGGPSCHFNDGKI